MINLTACFYNAHLFGGTAEYQVQGARHETGFYFHDAQRLPQMIDRIRRTDADFVGLSEIWDRRMGREIVRSLSDVYPYHVESSWGAGLGGAINRMERQWPRVAGALFGGDGGVVNFFTNHHYQDKKSPIVQGLEQYVSEDRFVRSLAGVLRSGPVWGAGLLFLSKHPTFSSAFVPHPVRADWERLADKGVLWVTVRLAGDRFIRLSLGHYQEGKSPHAVQARREQILNVSRASADSQIPVIHMGDFNVVGETDEYDWMIRQLKMPEAPTGATYEDPNPYQEKLRAPRPLFPEAQRVDYIFHSRELGLVSAQALQDEFRDENGLYYLSDHFPVLARLML